MNPVSEQNLERAHEAFLGDHDRLRLALLARLKGHSIKPAHRSRWHSERERTTIPTWVKIGTVAAAALLFLGLAVRMGGLLDGTLAWADVQTAFLGQHWVHVAYDNGS
jgi:hypothetical protein